MTTEDKRDAAVIPLAIGESQVEAVLATLMAGGPQGLAFALASLFMQGMSFGAHYPEINAKLRADYEANDPKAVEQTAALEADLLALYERSGEEHDALTCPHCRANTQN